MRIRGFTLTALAVLVLGCSASSYAATVTELTLNDGLGNTVTFDVSNTNVVTSMGTGSNSVITAIFTPATGLVVLGTVGQFTFSTTGAGRLTTLPPTREDLTQVNATSTGAGNLAVSFTDTGYTGLGPTFLLGVSGVEDAAISGSMATFQGLGSAANAIPATTSIGMFTGLSGVSFATSGSFANPIGSSGSLTERTTFAFTGQGRIQADFTISNAAAVPEPASIVFLGTTLLGLTALFRKKLQF